MSAPQPILNIENLHVTFTGGAKPVRAVAGVSLSLGRGEVVALLGEFGLGQKRDAAVDPAAASGEENQDRRPDQRCRHRCHEPCR